MMTLNHDLMATSAVDEKKEEKLALAKQKLKQYKKEKETRQINGSNNVHDELNINLINSGRSSPSSAVTPHSYNYNNNQNSHHHITNQISPTSQLSQPTPFPPVSTQTIDNLNINQVNLKEQLQLHVQTIGILVAEKAELQSKFHQQLKKCDKKQEECDELMGRLKASRQKITDLEKLIQQINQQQQQNHSDQHQSEINVDISNRNELDKLRTELTTNQFLVDELKMRLNESNEKLAIKDQEAQKLSHITLELKSQMEIMQLKMTQLNNSNIDNEETPNYKPNYNDEELVNSLRETNADLERKLNEANKNLEINNEKLKSEYQTYVDQMRNQIESLVDQINRMSDERENAFAKIDHLESVLSTTQKTNQSLVYDLEELKKKLNEQNQSAISNDLSHDGQSNEKIQLLENEIKYFKQQIDILLIEQAQLKGLLDEKEVSIGNLNKLVDKYESDREQYNRLLEQTHSDKQTISRILKQNNDLKQQFNELQDAYVNVTKQNLELATQLESEQFKYRKLYDEYQNNPNSNNNNNNNNDMVNNQSNETQNNSTNNDDNNEWPEDNSENNATTETFNNASETSNSLMDGVKQKLEYLQKENTDLNDYITLVNKQLTEKNQLIEKLQNDLKHFNEQSLNPNEQHENLPSKINDNLEELNHKRNEIMLLKETIKELELEKSGLFEKLELSKSSQSLSTTTPSVAKNEGIEINETYLNNMKLLEEKFNKVMKDNADLIEKNLELEHVIQQLQFETETIIDYISMYQMERLKLNEKYKVKDEAIRSLSTQLQVNKLALSEISNYFNAFINISINSESDESKIQPQNLNNSNKEEVDTEAISNDSNNTVIVKEYEKESADSREYDEKKVYLLNQIQQLLNDLTNKTSNILRQTSESNRANNSNNSNKLLNIFEQKLGETSINNHNDSINPQSIADFRMHTILCSNCYERGSQFKD